MLIPSLVAPFLGIAIAFALDARDHLADPRAARPRRVNACSAARSSSRAASSRSRTARTTRRRQWGSSRWRSSRPATSIADFTRPPTWVIVSLGAGDGGGDVRGRLAHHQDARPARSRRSTRRRGSPPRPPCAAILWTTAHHGFPVSTTHTISGSVIGAGAFRGVSAVRWGVAGNIVVAWVLTIPMAGLVGACHGERDADARGRRRRLPARRSDRGLGVPRPGAGTRGACSPRRPERTPAAVLLGGRR